eukprot:6192728-Alexandrium_andersonii.AAC.1
MTECRCRIRCSKGLLGCVLFWLRGFAGWAQGYRGLGYRAPRAQDCAGIPVILPALNQSK